MPQAEPPDPLDLIPKPCEIQQHIATAARTQRLLRRLLRLSLTARREREANALELKARLTSEETEVAHVG